MADQTKRPKVTRHDMTWLTAPRPAGSDTHPTVEISVLSAAILGVLAKRTMSAMAADMV